MTYVIIKKNNGKIQIIKNPSEITIENEKNRTHLCWDCENYEHCQKILDIAKRPIGEYLFIEDGIQIINEQEMETFLVSKCRNFYKSLTNTKTIEDKIKEQHKARIAREELRKAYFDADNLEEANKIQYELYKKGLLTNIRGKKPQNPNESAKVKTKTRKK